MKSKHILLLACLAVVCAAGCILDSGDKDLLVADGTVTIAEFPHVGPYTILTDANVSYSPINLPPYFAVEGLRVHFEALHYACYTTCTDPSVWGGCIELQSIRTILPDEE